MLNAFRRSPGSLRSCLRAAACPVTHHLSPLSRYTSQVTRNIPFTSAIRTFYAAPRLYNDTNATNDAASSRQSNGQPYIEKFSELADHNLVCKTIVKTLTGPMGLETLTPVQSKTINKALKGTDVIAQARTGTGKTIAFLLPVLQNIISADPSLEQPSHGKARPDIRALIISPTRELAEQIASEARKVVKNTGIKVQTAVGGSAKSAGLRKIQTEGCHILVGTPGRLNDILSDRREGITAPNLSAFVLDEADRLLDQGFAPEIKNIENFLPNRNEVDRQTLMFSATVPNEVLAVVKSIMKPDYQFVQTIRAGEAQTHERVEQKIVTMPGFENTIPAIIELAKRELARTDAELPFKAVVFFNANAEAILAAATFKAMLPADRYAQGPFGQAKIVEMHARLSQTARTRNADGFRKAKSGIMFSSDVSARGMDFPNVTHVIQAGLPGSSDTYVHRLGRTARGDKNGEGWLFVSQIEAKEAEKRLQGFKLVPDASLETASIDMTRDAEIAVSTATMLTEAVQAAKKIDPALKSAAYKATLGVYQWFNRKQTLIEAMNRRTKFGWGMPEPPSIPPKLAAKLGLARVEGVVVRHDPYEEPVMRAARGGKDVNRGLSRGHIGSKGSLHASSTRDRGGSRGFSGRDSERPSRSYGGDRESGGEFRGGGRNYGERSARAY